MQTFRNVLSQRWQLALAASVIATAILLATFRPILLPQQTYVNFLVGQDPLDSSYVNDEERYYFWVTSEYVAIALRDWANGSEFLTELRWRLWVQGYRFELEELDELLQWSVNSTNVFVRVEHVDAEMTRLVAQEAAATFLAYDSAKIPQLNLSRASVKQIDYSLTVEETAPTIRKQLELPLRLMAGLGVGPLLLVFIARRNSAYATAATIEALGLPLVGEIPTFTIDAN